MNYLHGKVNKEEAELACLYEYARESPLLRQAAEERDRLRTVSANKKLDCEKVALFVAGRHPDDWFSRVLWAIQCLGCESFPRKPFTALAARERKRFTRFYQTKRDPPLPVPDVFSLKEFGALDKFRVMADEAERVVEERSPGTQGKPLKLVPAVLQKWASVYCAVFDLDFSKGETQLVKEFRGWLRLPENRKRLKEHPEPRIGKTGKPLDRLKDLAVRRLHDRLGFDEMLKFAEKNRKNATTGAPLPFHDARQGQTKKMLLNQAPLYSEPSLALKAITRAKHYLAEIMPLEFKAPGVPEPAWKQALLKDFNQLERAAKVSKRNS